MFIRPLAEASSCFFYSYHRSPSAGRTARAIRLREYGEAAQAWLRLPGLHSGYQALIDPQAQPGMNAFVTTLLTLVLFVGGCFARSDGATPPQQSCTSG